jgi:hypothetical protein
LPNRIRGACHHDRDRARRVLGRTGRYDAPCHDHLNLEPDQLGHQVGEPLFPPLRIAGLNDKVLALDIAEVAQPLPEGLQSWIGIAGRAGLEPTDPIHVRRRLGGGGKRRHEDGQGEDDEECNGTMRHHGVPLACAGKEPPHAHAWA